MKKLLTLTAVLLSALISYAQKPDFLRTPNGPNTIVDWNLKAKTFVLPHGPTVGLHGSQDTTGNVYFRAASGDTSLNIRVGGVKWWSTSQFATITGLSAYKLKSDSTNAQGYVRNWKLTNALSNYVPTSRLVSTGIGLLGGGNLGSNLTLLVDTANIVTKNFANRYLKLGSTTSTTNYIPYLNDNNELVINFSGLRYLSSSSRYLSGVRADFTNGLRSSVTPTENNEVLRWQDTTIYRTAVNSFTKAEISSGYQPLNTKLTAIGALANGNGFLKNNGSGTFSYDLNTYYKSGDNVSLGSGAFSSSLTSVGLLLNTGGYLGSRSLRAASDLLILYGGTDGFNFTDYSNSAVLASLNNSGVFSPLGFKLATGASNGYVLKSDGSGNASWQPTTSSYKGTWNASTNTPTIADGTGATGDYYSVSAGGTQFGRTFTTGGLAIYNGSIWEPIGVAASVTSVNGLTGTPVINPTLSGNNIGTTGGSATIDVSTATGVANKMPLAGGTFTGGVNGTTLDLSSTLDVGGTLTLDNGEVQSGTSVKIGANTSTIYFRPNGVGSSTGQITLDASGDLSMGGYITTPGVNFSTGTYQGSRSIRAASDMLISYGGTNGFNWTDATNSTVLASLNNSGALAVTGPITGSNLSNINTGDNAANTTSNAYADGKVANNLTSSSTVAPSKDAVNTALALKADLASPTFTGTVGGITKSMVGLGNVDNTSDANKPVSTAQQTAIDAKVADNLTASTTVAPSKSAVNTALALKEDVSNKSTSTSLGTSDVLYPTQNAVKVAIENAVSTGGLPSGTPTIVLGLGAGTGASYSIEGDNKRGYIIVTTGTTPTTGATIFTATFAGGLTYGTRATTVTSPASQFAATDATKIYSANGPTAFSLVTRTGQALTASEIYSWYYVSDGY